MTERSKRDTKSRLVPMDFSHTGHIVTWRNDPENAHWFHEKRTFSKAAHETWLKGQLESRSDRNWVVLDSWNRPVAAVSVYKIDPVSRKAEFGRLVVGREHQGLGYGRAAVALAIDEARRLNLTSLYLSVKSDNERAIAIYERLGFVRDPSGGDETQMNLDL